MINKKYLAVIIAILFLMFLGGTIYYYVNSRPENITKKITTNINKNKDLEKYLTDNFINKINNDSPSSKEYLDSAVSNYAVAKDVKSIEIADKTEDKFVAAITISTVTTNSKTKFQVITTDRYKAIIVKDGLGWKIDNYELIDSKKDN